MTYRTLFFNFLLSLSFIFYSPAVYASYAVPNMQDFEKELAEANKVVEEWLSTLSPEEQDAFNQQVEDFSQMFENMSDEEFDKLLGDMFANEPIEQTPFDFVEPTSQETTEAITLSAEDKKKAETALAIINDLITQSNLFMVLVNSSAELPNRINGWADKGALSHWQAGTKWDAFEKEIEKFIQQLYRLEDQDITAKKYKYLLEFIAEESLYNNVIQLQQELKSLLPIINIPEFNIQKLSAESKTTIKKVLSKFAEAFYLLNIPSGLTELFEKYAPEEERIKASEEAATQRASESARMMRTPVEQVSTGAEPGGYGDYGYGDYGYGGGYSPYGYDNYYGDYDGYSPYGDYGDYGYGGDRSGDSDSSRSGRGGGAGGRSGESATREETEKPDEQKKEEEKRSRHFTPEYQIERAIADIKTGLEDIASTMHDEEGNPTEFATKLRDIVKDDEINEAVAQFIIPSLDKKVSLIADAIKKIDSKELSTQDLAHYQKELQRIFDTNKKELENLHTLISTNFINKTKEEIDKEKKNKTKEEIEKLEQRINITDLTNTQKWAYFGGDESLLTGDDQELIEKITSPKSLLDVDKGIEAILKDMKSFFEKKSKTPQKSGDSERESFSLPDLDIAE